MSNNTVSEMQSEIMKLAHKFKTGPYIDRASTKQAANVVAQRYGYKSGEELQRMIGLRNQKKNLAQSPAPDHAGKASTDVVERYIKLIEENNGLVPLDWILLREWMDVTATELRHARKAAIARGYKKINTKGDCYVFEAMAALPEILPEPTNGNGDNTIQQTALPFNYDFDAICAVLNIISSKLDDVIKEQRQLRAITTAAWTPNKKSTA